MKKITVKMSVGTTYVGSTVSDEVEFEFEDNATPEEIEKQIDEYYDEWVWDRLNSSWNIINEESIEEN
jgi:hypothetical protein